MSNFSGKHLRVRTPLTTDGSNLLVGDDEKIKFKTTYLPFSAKEKLEKINKARPAHLQHKIEVLGGEPPVPVNMGTEEEKEFNTEFTPDALELQRQKEAFEQQNELFQKQQATFRQQQEQMQADKEEFRQQQAQFMEMMQQFKQSQATSAQPVEGQENGTAKGATTTANAKTK